MNRTDGTLAQNIATTAGQHYTLSFWIASDNNGLTPINHFTVEWNGQTLMALTNAPDSGYQLYTFDLVGISGNSVLEFNGYNHPDAWRLDDVTVTAVGVPGSEPTPTPTTGTSGNDVLKGTSGADILTGLAGNDTYTVNSTGDKVVELANEGIDKVESTISYMMAGNIENLQLMGDATINGAGNDLDNTIIGNDVSNSIEGNVGNDTLNGWGGKDTFFGGIGNDVFQFSSQFSADGDTVMDFIHGVDKLDFSKIDAGNGGQAFLFDGYNDGGSNGHLWAVEDQAAGVTHVYGKTGDFQFHIDLQGLHLGLTTSDFIL
jgi:Ca2+-binding RTX toxin-like protein